MTFKIDDADAFEPEDLASVTIRKIDRRLARLEDAMSVMQAGNDAELRMQCLSLVPLGHPDTMVEGAERLFAFATKAR